MRPTHQRPFAPSARAGFAAVLVGSVFAHASVFANDRMVDEWIAAPRVRLVVVRAEGADYRWADFPRPPGLNLKILASCRVPPNEDTVCDTGGVRRNRLALEPGRASAWTWRGEQVAVNVEPDRMRQTLGRYLGPKPRVWVQAADPATRSRLMRALSATGRWTVTHRIQDIEAIRRIESRRDGALATCEDRRLPPLSTLQVRGGRADWIDVGRDCRTAVIDMTPSTAAGPSVEATAKALLAAWRAPVSSSEPSVGETAPSAVATPKVQVLDRHHRKTLATSRDRLNNLPPKKTDPRLVAAARPWLGVRYQRDGDTTAGIDDFNLIRALYRDAYDLTLDGEAVDWLQIYEKVPLDERFPDVNLRPGDLLFKVSLAYRPRGVSVYLGQGLVVTSKLIKGVVVDPITKNLPETFFLVARRPSIYIRGR